jgi:hypothetical protein
VKVSILWRILSPERQKYESLFERYVKKKNVEDKLEDQPAPKLEFDTTTKPTGTQNALVNKKLKYEKQVKAQAKKDQMLKSLPVLEKDAQEILEEEVTAIMAKDLLNKLKEVFDSCKERGKEEIDEVETAEFVASIVEDPSLSKKLDQPVRTSVDDVIETLEELLHRVLKTHKAEG